MTKIRNVFLIFLMIIITNNLSYSSILSNQDDEYNNEFSNMSFDKS